MDEYIRNFNQGLQTGFVNKAILSNLEYQPKLILNQKNPPKKVLTSILQELENCNYFYFSVAFVTTSGVATIINKLDELRNRNIKGKILVSQYLNFTQPEALTRLLQFENIDLRIATNGNVHSKGYIFKSEEHYNIIVGSSNLTAQALSTNKEWNLKISAFGESGIANKVLEEFHSDFKSAVTVNEDFIRTYQKLYHQSFQSRSKIQPEHIKDSKPTIFPNSMQNEALRNLKKLRDYGKRKALIISATGTGKTFLSAFDAKEFQAKKLLFVVHRLTIAKDALNTFQSIYGNEKTMGLYSGNNRDLECDFIFSTIQTISKSDHLKNFSKYHFDYIIIDESHRSGADSYLRLIEYFEPNFILGMTATPERTDGNNIFQLFDHNIAYEIRLSKAMEEAMLCDFHYYGVTDLSIDNNIIDKKSDFRYLVSNERVERIIEYTKFYGSDNGINRGLIFCSRKNEAKELSELFNLKGFKTIALTGDDSEEERANAIKKLETDDLSEKIDYIFTVDIFNEGIDIPKINQIIMLRPTDSAIIFIQQLGRGLRIAKGKSYLTVIDFIGNFENNYLIPCALFGDTTYNKDTLRKLLSEGSRMIPGASTINFEKVAKEKIFQSIDSANMQLLADLKKDYNLLKYKLGRNPMMMDFIENEARDPFHFVDYSGSHYNFYIKVEKPTEQDLTKQEIKLLELFSKEINNSKRIEESLILKMLIEFGKLKVSDFKSMIQENYSYSVADDTIQSCLINLNFKFIRQDENIVFLKDNIFYLHDAFKESLNKLAFKDFLTDSTLYSIHRFNVVFKEDFFKNGLILYNKYSRKDVCRLLNWEKDISSTVYGYRTHHGITPCFVTYNKSETIDNSINYNDHFITPSTFAWESRSNRKLDESEEIQRVLNSRRILLFVKKRDDEGSEFYFLGDVTIIPNSVKQKIMPNTGLPIVHFKFKLEYPVLDSLYHYITTTEDKIVELNSKPLVKTKLPVVQKTLNFEEELKNPIPLYDFYAAAGSFSQLQTEKNYTLIEGPTRRIGENYFACKIVGESMNRVIPNGSICLFKREEGGSRNGKIVLVENRDIQDVDFNSSFTIKVYSSEKRVSEDSWSHQVIVLKPNSFDSKYQDIIITEDNAAEMKIVGEFVEVLK